MRKAFDGGVGGGDDSLSAARVMRTGVNDCRGAGVFQRLPDLLTGQGQEFAELAKVIMVLDDLKHRRDEAARVVPEVSLSPGASVAANDRGCHCGSIGHFLSMPK